MTRAVATQVDGFWLVTRIGTPNLWVFGVTVEQARMKMARQLRSWRRYQQAKATRYEAYSDKCCEAHS